MVTMSPTKFQRLDHHHSVEAIDFRPHKSPHHHHGTLAVISSMISRIEDAHYPVCPHPGSTAKESLPILSQLRSRTKWAVSTLPCLAWRQQSSTPCHVCGSPWHAGHQPHPARIPPLEGRTHGLWTNVWSTFWHQWEQLVANHEGGKS